MLLDFIVYCLNAQNAITIVLLSNAMLSQYVTTSVFLLHRRGKRESKPSAAPPPSAGPRISSSQPSEADSRRSILEAVAKQTGGKLVEQAPPPEMVVSDAMSDEEVERKSKTIVGELSSNGDYKVCELYGESVV